MTQSQTDPTQLAYATQGQASNGYYPPSTVNAQNNVQYAPQGMTGQNPFISGLENFGARALMMAPAFFMGGRSGGMIPAMAGMSALAGGVQGYNAQNQYDQANQGYQKYKQGRINTAPNDYFKTLYTSANSLQEINNIDDIQSKWNEDNNPINKEGSNSQYVNGATATNPSNQAPPSIMPTGAPSQSVQNTTPAPTPPQPLAGSGGMVLANRPAPSRSPHRP